VSTDRFVRADRMLEWLHQPLNLVLHGLMSSRIRRSKSFII
jgi:hypothetical protein